MTLEEIKSNMRTLNEDLDAIIVSKNFDETKWEECASKIVNGILEDKSVKKVLLQGTPEARKEYLEAIKIGIQRALEKLQEHSVQLHNSGLVDKEMAFNNVAQQGEQLEDTVLTLEAIENDDRIFVYTDSERITDLEKKIYYIDSTIGLKTGVEELEKVIPLKNGENIENKLIKISENMQKEFAEFEKDLKKINELRTSQNLFMQYLSEMNELSFNSEIDMTNEEQKRKIKEMVRLAGLLDQVDFLDSKEPKADKLKLSKPKYEDKDGKEIDPNEAVETWISTINAKLESETKANKMNLEPEFLDSRERIIRDRFIEKYIKSDVHKILTPEMYKKVLEEKDFEIEELKSNIIDLKEKLKKYRILSKKKPEELLEYKKEAEKLLGYYKTVADGPQKIRINGTVKELQTDMTDISRKFDAVDEILELDNDDELKKQVESKAMVLAGERPTDRWYHKLAKFITLGIYKTPEQKYEVKLYKKRVDIVSDLITENKNNLEEAKINVEYDKNAYKEAARKKVYGDKDTQMDKRKFDKKNVLKARDNSQPLTR